jgi:hypothetical protein
MHIINCNNTLLWVVFEHSILATWQMHVCSWWWCAPVEPRPAALPAVFFSRHIAITHAGLVCVCCRVNLRAPQKTIIVQLVRTVCCICVVDSYKQLARFNVRKLAEDELEQQIEQQQQAAVKQEAEVKQEGKPTAAAAAAAAAAAQEAVKEEEKPGADAAAAEGAAAAEVKEEAAAEKTES